MFDEYIAAIVAIVLTNLFATGLLVFILTELE